MTTAMPIPAVCGICGEVFASPFALSEGSSLIFESEAYVGDCSNGHTAGTIPKGTYSIYDGIMRISLANREAIRAIALDAQAQKRDAHQALDEIVRLLPAESAAAVKQLGANPFVAFAIILYFLGAIGSVVGAVATAYRALFPVEPAPTTIITNYNTTNIHTAAPADTGKEPSTQRPAGVGSKQHRVEKKSTHTPKGEGDKSMLHPKSSKRRDRRQRAKTTHRKSPL